MTFDELYSAAFSAIYDDKGGTLDLREAVLAVLDEISASLVPSKAKVHKDYPKAVEFDRGWNSCRDEMLRRLRGLRGG